MKKPTAKKKPGRPSKLKTPLAVLRHLITVPAEHKGRFLKRKGRYEVERVTLPVSTVAKWLGVKPSHVRSIERGKLLKGKPGYPLIRENAEIIEQNTGVNLSWLLGRKTKNPINICGLPYCQNDFDRRQASVQSPIWPALRAQEELKAGIAWLATIYFHAYKRGEVETYASKMKSAFWEIFSTFPKNETVVGFGNFIDQTGTSFGQLEAELKPLVKNWAHELLQVAGAREHARKTGRR
jgi:hypothetical protein